MNKQELRDNVGYILPLLALNLKQAHQEYMDSELPHGAYVHVQARHQLAEDIINSDIDDIKQAYTAASMLTIDLRAGLRDFPEQADKLSAWVAFLQVSGMTETNSFLDVPAFPRTQEIEA
jgi:hypothetical protein